MLLSMAPRRFDPFDDPGPLGDPDEEGPTARPSRAARGADELDEDRVVPQSNVGGAAPTPLGQDSGGDLPGSEDDLSSLSEPEPPGAPELEGLSVREEDLPPGEEAEE
jgi:hypothetical protein